MPPNATTPPWSHTARRRASHRARLGAVYHVRRKGQDRIAVRYWVGDQRRWELQPPGTTTRQARRRLADLATAETRGELPLHTGIPFDTYAQAWLHEQETLCRADALKPSTYRDRETTIRLHLTPFFGNLPLDEITRADCRAFQLQKLQEGKLSPTTINGRLRVLHAILKHAVEADLIPHNPTQTVKRLRTHPPVPKYYEVADAHRLIQATQPQWRALIAIAAFAGLRQGEILALRWTDINWNTNHIHIQRTLQRPDKLLGHETSRFTTPKTPKSVRHVPLRPIVRHHLEQHHLHYAVPNDHNLIFATTNGQPIDAHNLTRRIYQPAQQRAGLPHIRFHDLRHTFVTYCAAAGVPQEQTRDWIGHTDTRTTEIYRHTSTSAETYALQTLDQFDRFINGTAQPPDTPSGSAAVLPVARR